MGGWGGGGGLGSAIFVIENKHLVIIEELYFCYCTCWQSLESDDPGEIASRKVRVYVERSMDAACKMVNLVDSSVFPFCR